MKLHDYILFEFEILELPVGNGRRIFFGHSSCTWKLGVLFEITGRKHTQTSANDGLLRHYNIKWHVMQRMIIDTIICSNLMFYGVWNVIYTANSFSMRLYNCWAAINCQAAIKTWTLSLQPLWSKYQPIHMWTTVILLCCCFLQARLSLKSFSFLL